MFKNYFKTIKSLFLIIIFIFSIIFNVHSVKILPYIFYNIKGKLECLTFITSKNSTIPLKVQITPISNVQIQLWDEDAKIKLPFGLILDRDDFLGDTTSKNDGTFHLTAKATSESFGFGDLEPYLIIKHKCTGNQDKLKEKVKFKK